MPTLTPPEAAAIATGVYRMRTNTISALHRQEEVLGFEDLFLADDASQFQGRSGGSIAGDLSGFGFIGTGKGRFAGEALIATRGTAMGIDWLSNFNVGMALGPSALPVHAGFNDVWKSFSDRIDAYLRNRNPSRVHCIGHSLGGALATLNADYLSNRGIPASLYTFGSPRAGGNLFSLAISRRLGAGNIHRVYHRGDPVPMIPIFPFSHVPFVGDGIGIGSLDSALVTAAHHKMGSSYGTAMAAPNIDWTALKAASDAAADHSSIQTWFDNMGAGRHPMLMGSAKLLGIITRAIAWVLQKSGQVLLAGIGVTVAVGATVVDKIAFLLHSGARLSSAIADEVNAIYRAIFQFLGRALSITGDITLGFMRWVLNLLFDSISMAARGAFNALV
jgi:pimeloyl-ACP methyl ester carboxylesterase